MATGDFTDDEKAAIRSYLGFSALYYLVDPRLESQIGTGGLGSSQPGEATRVRTILANLAAIDTAIQNAALNNLTLTKAEDVNFLGPDQIAALQDYGRTLIQQLGIVFFLKPQRDYYGSESSDGGGMIELG